MHVPRAVLLLALLSGLYALLAPFLDRPLQDRPLENPYHLLLGLERDATLRSSYYSELATLRRTSPPQVHDFDTPVRLEQQVAAAPSLAPAFAPQALVPGGGSLVVPRSASSAGLRILVPVPEAWAGRACVLEARFAGGGTASAELWPAVAASHEPARGPRLVLADLPAGTPAPEGSAAVPAGAWQEWQAVVETPRAGLLALDVHHGFEELRCDEIVLRPATRVEACLDGGHARATGATEATRELKRMVARGADERLCLALPSASVLTYVLELPEEPARLDLAWSAAASGTTAGRTELTVAISREGEFEETLLRTALGVEDCDRFLGRSLDLARHAGQRVRLQFRVSPLDSGDGPLALLADPTLTADSREEPPPHVILLTYGSEEFPGGTDPFARLRAEGLTVAGVADQGRDAEQNVFALLTGLGAPPGPRPPQSVPELSGGRQPLVEAFLARGYLPFAAVARARSGPLLQGFLQRASGLLEDPVAAALRWLDEHRDQSCFVWVELPAPESLGTFLRGFDAQRLEPALLVLAPEGDGPLIFRLPGRVLRDQECVTPLRAADVGATVFRLLGEDPPATLAGRAFSAEDLLRGTVPAEASGPRLFQWSDPGLPPRHALFLTPPPASSGAAIGGGG